MNKNGVLEIQFNWIFVLIAGAVILMFFISIVYIQKGQSETKVSHEVLNNLDAIMSASQVSKKVFNVLQIPRTKIIFDCTDCFCTYYAGTVGRRSEGKQLSGKVVFSPRELETRSLYTWSQDWNMGFRVMNFLYLTHPGVRYYILNSTKGIELYNLMPDELNKVLYSPDNFSGYMEEASSRFVIFNADVGVANSTGFTGNDLTALVITGSDFETGDLVFYSFNTTDGSWSLAGTTKYIGLASMLGGIFTHEPESYNCLMQSAFERLNILAQLYFTRTDELSTYYGSSNYCGIQYNPLLFSELVNANFQSVINGNFDVTIMRRLSTINDDLNKKSCPTMY